MDKALVEQIHYLLVKYFSKTNDPLSPCGVKDHGLLESACARAETVIIGCDPFPTCYDKAAVLMHGIISSHCFNNGNKRTALLCALYKLADSNIWVDGCSDIEMLAFVKKVAAHDIVEDKRDEVSHIAAWLNAHSRKVSKIEQRMSFSSLKEVLVRFGYQPIQKDNFIEIYKDGKFKTRILKKGQKGQEEYDQVYIAKLRDRLNLTVKYGIDSARFYGLKGVSEKFGEFMTLRGEVFRNLSDA